MGYMKGSASDCILGFKVFFELVKGFSSMRNTILDLLGEFSISINDQQLHNSTCFDEGSAYV
jgi:hypothetical protein